MKLDESRTPAAVQNCRLVNCTLQVLQTTMRVGGNHLCQGPVHSPVTVNM